ALAVSLLALGGRGALGCADGVVNPPSSPDSPQDGSVDGAAGETPDADAAPDAPTVVPTCSADGWCHTKLPTSTPGGRAIVPGPNGVRLGLSSVWVAPDHHAWAVSTGGHLLHWNGEEWKIELATTTPLRCVWGASASDLWVGGDSGFLLHGTGSAGLTFQQVS